MTYWACAGLVAMLAYVLSIGPAALLVANALPPAAVGIVLVFYMPLMVVAETTEPTKELLQWYVHLWAEHVAIGV